MADDFSEWPLFEWAKQPAAESTTSSAVPLPLDSSMVYRDGASIPSPGVLGVVEMPPREQALELVDIFFDRFSWLLPCFREATLREGFSTQEIQNRAPVLAYAIFAMAAPHHSEAAIRDQAESWYNNAKLSYDLTDHHSDRTLWVLQAAVCIIFHCFTTLRGSGMWLFIGKAWRQACWAGLNRMDSGVEPPLGDIPDAALPWEKEERRRTLWVLFILDRTCSFISGRTPAIDERYFAVNVPLPDGMFHCGVDIPVSFPTEQIVSASTAHRSLPIRSKVAVYLCQLALMLQVSRPFSSVSYARQGHSSSSSSSTRCLVRSPRTAKPRLLRTTWTRIAC